jgi:hypothetical protein
MTNLLDQQLHDIAAMVEDIDIDIELYPFDVDLSRSVQSVVTFSGLLVENFWKKPMLE